MNKDVLKSKTRTFEFPFLGLMHSTSTTFAFPNLIKPHYMRIHQLALTTIHVVLILSFKPSKFYSVCLRVVTILFHSFLNSSIHFTGRQIQLASEVFFGVNQSSKATPYIQYKFQLKPQY